MSLAQVHKRTRSVGATGAPLFPKHEFFLHHYEAHIMEQQCASCSHMEQLTQIYAVYLHPFYGVVNSTLRNTLIQKLPLQVEDFQAEYPILRAASHVRHTPVCEKCLIQNDDYEKEPFTQSHLMRAAEGARIENENLRMEMRKRDAEENAPDEGRRARVKKPTLTDEEIF